MSQRTSRQMYPLVEKWQRSEKSKKDFCSHHQINLHTFTYWVNKYNKPKEAVSSGETGTSNFVTLQVNEPTKRNQPPSVEIIYPNGVQLRLNGTPSLPYLQSLLQSTV